MIQSVGFLALRLCVGVLLIHHGYEKLDNIENFADAFVRPLHLPFPIVLSYIVAIFGTITIAIYHAIATAGFNIYLLELLGLYWGGAACLILNGGGNFSIDYLISKRLKT